jgi:hypothetical protein
MSKEFWEKYKLAITCVAGTFTLIALLVASPYRPTLKTEHVELKSDLEQVSMRLEQKIIRDDQRQIQQRIWKLEDRYENAPSPELKDEIRELELEQEELDSELKENKDE